MKQTVKRWLLQKVQRPHMSKREGKTMTKAKDKELLAGAIRQSYGNDDDDTEELVICKPCAEKLRGARGVLSVSGQGLPHGKQRCKECSRMRYTYDYRVAFRDAPWYCMECGTRTADGEILCPACKESD